MKLTITIPATKFALATAAAACQGLSLDAAIITHRPRRATTTPVMEETPEHRAALPHVEAPAAAPVRKAAPTTGLLDIFGGDDAEDDAANI